MTRLVSQKSIRAGGAVNVLDGGVQPIPAPATPAPADPTTPTNTSSSFYNGGNKNGPLKPSTSGDRSTTGSTGIQNPKYLGRENGKCYYAWVGLFGLSEPFEGPCPN